MSDDDQPPEDPIASDLVREDASFVDIVLQFVDGLDVRLEAMENAIRESDFEALRIAADQLKGSGGGYGYPMLTEQAAEVERQAKAQVLEECRQAVDDLTAICERIVVSDEEDV